MARIIMKMPATAPPRTPDSDTERAEQSSGNESALKATERVLEQTIVGNPTVTVVTGIVGGAALGFAVGDVIGIVVGALIGGLVGARARVAD
jgi:uncharacterized protein YcfJ